MCLEWHFPLTGFGAAESGVDRHVLRSFAMIAMFVFIAPWLAVVVSYIGSAWIAGAVASTSEPTVFSHAKAGHQSGKGCHGLWFFLTEVAGEPLIPDAVFEGREGFNIRTIDNLVLFN